MKKTLKKILLTSGFVLGIGLVGTGLYLEEQRASCGLYMLMKLGGLITVAGISGLSLRPLANEVIANTHDYSEGDSQ